MKFLATLLLALVTACAPASRAIQVSSQVDFVESNPEFIHDSMIKQGDSHAWLLPKIEKWAERRGMLLLSEPMTDDEFGYTFIGRVIVVNANMPKNAQVSTALHEASHNLHYCPTKAQRETFSETVATLVAQRFGLNTWRESASYLSLIPDLIRRATLYNESREIEAVALKLEQELRDQ